MRAVRQSCYWLAAPHLPQRHIAQALGPKGLSHFSVRTLRVGDIPVGLALLTFAPARTLPALLSARLPPFHVRTFPRPLLLHGPLVAPSRKG